ncbi:MAG: TonB-dependent receptor [Verrucomicrobiota bacterium]|nr:TonB-dependent receptor [Verrucomicrobiota bacterium]
MPTTYVNASRFLEIDKDLAANIQFIDRKSVEDSTASNLVELLEKETSLIFKSTSGNASSAETGMRGYGENSGQRVLVLLDGHRLNTADLNRIDWLSIPLALVENVEIIRGSQTALYGNNASAGVIRITTRRPTDGLSGGASAEYGSYESYNFRAGLTDSVGLLGYSAHAEHNETDGFRDNSQYETTGGGFRLVYPFFESLEGYFSLTASESKFGLPGGLTLSQYKTDPQQTTDPDNHGESEAYYLRGGLNCQWNEVLSVNFDGGYTSRSVDSDFSGFIFEQDYDLYSFSPSVTYNHDGFKSVLGLDWMEDRIDVGSDRLERDRIGYFASLQYKASPRWIISTALRYEENESNASNVSGSDSAFNDAYAWSLGAIRKLNSARLYASLSRFYRFPAIDEIANTFPVPSFNPNLKTETGHEIEVGLEKAFTRTRVSFSAFYRKLDDEVVLDPTIGFFGTNVNFDETLRYGLEFYFDYGVHESLDLMLDYTLVSAEIDHGTNDGKKIPLVPNHQLNLGFDWQPIDSWTFIANVRYYSAYHAGGDFSNMAEELDGRVVIDLSVRYQLSVTSELFAGIDNLTDKDYVSTAISDGMGTVVAFYPASGRSMKAGIRWRF